MAYETKIVKTLRFPGNETEQYQINAAKLGGKTLADIEEQIEAIASFDALIYKGALAAGATLPAANKGDVYKVTSNGEIAGAKVEIGDMLICNTDATPENTPANWDVIQANIDVAAILDHTHEGTVDLTSTNKTLSHAVTYTKETITGEFTDGAASVTGNHGHTASGKVSVSEGGSVQAGTVTAEGSVALTTSDTAQTGDVTITPSGSLNTATTVTKVEAGDTTVSAHSITESSAGEFTPEGTVSVNEITPEGSVASHKHNVVVTPSTATIDVATALTATADGEGDDAILNIGINTSAITYVSDVEASEDNVAPAFTGTAVTPQATFSGSAVEGHTHSVSVADHDKFIPTVSVTSEAHEHTFTGDVINVRATFTGSATTHSHDFTAAPAQEKAVEVTVADYSGTFSGTASGNVELTNAADVVKGVSIENHTISTVDSAKVEIGSGKQD